MAIHTRDKLGLIILPWGILALSFVVNTIIAALLGGNVGIYTGGVASIYIYMLVVGALIIKETFPFAVGFSVRRIDYFLGTMALAVAVSAAYAFLLSLLSLTESNLTNNWGVGLHFFHLPYWSNSSLIGQFWTYFIVMLFCFMLGFAPASLYRRFGMLGLYAFMGAVGVVSSVLVLLATYRQWWGDIFTWLSQWSAVQFAWWLVPVTLIGALGSYVLLRRASA
jgi:hypothetical protein